MENCDYKNILFRFIRTLFVIGTTVLLNYKTSIAEPKFDIDFVRDIQPIFQEHCWKCHGGEKQKGGLRLDDRSAALLGGDSGPALKLGHSSKSLLISLVSGADPEKVMPPKGDRLSEAQIQSLRQWIDAQAPWPKQKAVTPSTNAVHWAFTPPQQVIPPRVPSVFHPIDRFIQASLHQEKMRLSPEADRATLIRRISLDLTGLLPNPNETRFFLLDQSPDAFERLVDRLLASPHFGERWGRHWLDLARYADSDGYQIDIARPWSHVYRTWVIESINADQPFDEFTIDQLAGDLRTDSSNNQTIAAGFHRNTLVNREEGADLMEFNSKAKVDRVSTTATTWMGLTLACAECHTHKYDPLSQREFYEMYAFFNEAEEIDAPLKPNGKSDETKRFAMTFRAMTNAPLTHIHVRGDFQRLGAEVQPNTPKALPPLKARNSHADRLDLAKWLVAPGHPLTSRVAVNHFWKHLFGRGLVPSEEDFGTQGDRPTHPQLLDWLAVEFEQKGWSRKHLLKLIVTSSTYRQSSHQSSRAVRLDPSNRLLSRQNRLPVESEIVRDIHLQTAGLLDESIGGASIRPIFPRDLYKIGYEFIASVTWQETKGPELFRRGIYIQSQRTVPYPLSTTFDAPDSNIVCTRRARSNNPLQSLARLNNDLFQRAARQFAERLRLEADTTSDKINLAFSVCLNREPTQSERHRLQGFYQHQLKLSASPRSEGIVMHPDDALAQLVLNLDEFTTRE